MENTTCEIPEKSPVLAVKDLTKRYPEFLLNGLTFSVEKGHICGFVGRNGAGKTTTVKAILNLIHADGGQIRWFGKDLKTNEAEIKSRIGYSTGAVSYYTRKKLREIVAVTKTFYPTWDEAAYRKYLQIFELDEDKTPRQLSEGMKVKFNLLLALSHHAEFLLLDEPTSGLDPFSRDDLLRLFCRLRDEGVTILFSTHIVSDLEKCADDLLYIKKGALFASLRKEEFIKTYGKDGETLEETILRLERGTEE